MRSIFIIAFTLFLVMNSFGQSTFTIVVKDAESKGPLPGASAIVVGANIGATSDENGVIEIENIPAGQQTLEVSFVGYQPSVFTIIFPTDTQPFGVLLEAVHEELDEILITSTRSSRTIADIPTRVELIAGEELEEKGNMKPGDIRMLLNESTGIQ